MIVTRGLALKTAESRLEILSRGSNLKTEESRLVILTRGSTEGSRLSILDRGPTCRAAVSVFHVPVRKYRICSVLGEGIVQVVYQLIPVAIESTRLEFSKWITVKL